LVETFLQASRSALPAETIDAWIN